MEYQPAIASGVAALHNQLMPSPRQPDHDSTPRGTLPTRFTLQRPRHSRAHFLAGSAHENLRVCAGDRCVIGPRLWRHVDLRPLLVFEVVVDIDASHERCAVMAAGNLADVSRDVADSEADAPVV